MVRDVRSVLKYLILYVFIFFFSSRRRHTRYWRDWSSDGVLFRSDVKPVADEGRAVLVGQLGAVEVELADDVCARQPHRAEVTVSSADKSPAEHIAVDMQPVADEGGPGVIGQPRTVEVELPLDASAEQPHRTVVTLPDSGEPVTEQIGRAHV